MGEYKSEKLEFIPAKIKVIEHIRPKYACRHCDKSLTQTQIKQASMPAMPINKGIATSSLLSQLITSKYQYGLPLYRQEAMFKHDKVKDCDRHPPQYVRVQIGKPGKVCLNAKGARPRCQTSWRSVRSSLRWGKPITWRRAAV